MTIRRLRPAYDAETLRQVYSRQYNHTLWEDHIQRVQATVDCVHAWTIPRDRRIVADLSCGDAAIADRIENVKLYLLGDYVENDEYAYSGPIEETIDLIGQVDLFILSETLEHIDDPVGLLRKIRQRATKLLITTPLDERDDGNPEHYWGWDEDGIRSLLADSGWVPSDNTIFTPNVPAVYYSYQIWLAK